MNAVHRIDVFTEERKSHCSPAQLGTYVKVQLKARKQSKPGRFRSLKALKNDLPAGYARHVDFLWAEGDLVIEEATGLLYVDGFDEWQKREARARISSDLRQLVIDRDGLVCQLCGGNVPAADVHLDHIHPLSMGGPTSLQNLQVTHSRCNIRKGAGLVK